MRRPLTERTDLAVNDLRATSYTRLEGIIKIHWSAMRAGDAAAAKTILPFIRAEVSLFQLDKAVEAPAGSEDMSTTVVAPEWMARHSPRLQR